MKTTLLFLAIFLIISSSLSHAEGHAKKEPKKPVKNEKKVLTPEQIAENKRFGIMPESNRKALLKLDKLDHRLVDTWVEIVQGDVDASSCDSIWGVKARKDAEKLKGKVVKARPRLLESFYSRYDRDLPKLEKMIERKQKEIDKFADQRPINNERIIAQRAKELTAMRAEVTLYEDMLSTLEEMNEKISGRARSVAKKMDRLSQIGISVGHGGSGFKGKTEQYKNVIEAAYDIKDRKADIKILETRKKDGKNWKSSDESLLKNSTADLERSCEKIKNLVNREQLKLTKTLTKMESDKKRLQAKLDGLPQDSKARDRLTDKLWPLETELFALQATQATLTRLADWKKL